MPRRKKRRSKDSADEHTHLSLRIEDYKVRATAGVNHHAESPQYAWGDTEDEPLYEFESHVELTAICIDPAPRAGASYTLMIYSDDNPESRLYCKLKDVQAVDEHRAPQYRTYRGKTLPLYKAPKGLGTLEKERGEASWRGAIFVQPRYVNDLLSLLGHQRQLYLAIHERKIERQRWIQTIGVQTTDPAEDRRTVGGAELRDGDLGGECDG